MRAVADVDGEPLVLWNVHIRAPIEGSPTDWLGDMKQLYQRIHSETEAVLVAGDFNATYGHRPYRNLLAGGFQEAAIDLGRGTACTWPVNKSGAKDWAGTCDSPTCSMTVNFACFLNTKSPATVATTVASSHN